MKIALLALAAGLAGVVLWKPAPPAGPEAIVYGRDACDHCRMHFAAKGFAAERRDSRGALHKYDDIGCMIEAGGDGDAWVEDHETGAFVPLAKATLVQAPKRTTPMASGLVAFGDGARAAAFAKAHDGQILEVRK